MALIKLIPIEEEFKKNPELKQTDLDMLKEWLKKQPHLPPISDSELILFLHSNYYRIEPTKTNIDIYFTVRTHVPEFFSNWDPVGAKEIREKMKIAYFLPLPKTTPEGYKVILSKLVNSDPSRYVFSDAMKLFSMSLDLWRYTTGTTPGHVIVFDMEGVVLGHVARLNPMLIKKWMYYLQDGLPVRLMGLYFINAVPFMDLILNLIKPFMKKDLLEKLFVYTNIESLGKQVPIDILTNEQGGKAGSWKNLWESEVQKLEQHRSWFQEEMTRKVNEAARPGKAKSITDIFGVEGSFKKLEVD